MIQQTQLAKAITLALTGTALAFGMASTASATSTTMYNMSTGLNGTVDLSAATTSPTAGGVWSSGYVGKTDGWTNGASTGLGVGTVAVQKWAGTASPTTAAFNYAGAHLNWGVSHTADGDVSFISTDDSFKYGGYADIDTAKGAWSDAALSGASGWRHDLEMGLFRSDVATEVKLSAVGMLQAGTQFGFTIFKGVDSITDYGHHGGWNANNNTAGLQAPGGAQAGTALGISDIVAYSTPTSNLNQISFMAEAGQIYTIFLGGYRNGGWGSTTDGYHLTVTSVPVPAAAWLFGGAMASLVGGLRRKRVIAA